MRITIEMSEAESRYTTVSREGERVAGATEGAPIDAGPPSTALLAALGGEAEAPSATVAVERQGTDGGAAPSWLVSVVEGGAGQRN